MMQRKDISKYIYTYFVEKDEKEHFVKGGIKMEQFFARSFHLKKKT
jgi:hypothetical protein